MKRFPSASVLSEPAEAGTAGSLQAPRPGGESDLSQGREIVSDVGLRSQAASLQPPEAAGEKGGSSRGRCQWAESSVSKKVKAREHRALASTTRPGAQLVGSPKGGRPLPDRPSLTIPGEKLRPPLLET